MSGLPRRERLRKCRAERGWDEGRRLYCVAVWLGSLGSHWPLPVFTLQLRMTLDSRSLTWERTAMRGRILSWNPFKSLSGGDLLWMQREGGWSLPSKAPHTAVYCQSPCPCGEGMGRNQSGGYGQKGTSSLTPAPGLELNPAGGGS